MQKPLWFKIKKDFDELTRDIYNNQDNDFKFTINKKLMIWKTQKHFGQK